jgi:hypothetical protein
VTHEPCFQHSTDADISVTKETSKEEKDENSKHVSHCMVVQCGDTVLQYEPKGLQQNDSTAATKCKTVTRSQNNYSQK